MSWDVHKLGQVEIEYEEFGVACQNVPIYFKEIKVSYNHCWEVFT